MAYRLLKGSALAVLILVFTGPNPSWGSDKKILEEVKKSKTPANSPAISKRKSEDSNNNKPSQKPVIASDKKESNKLPAVLQILSDEDVKADPNTLKMEFENFIDPCGPVISNLKQFNSVCNVLLKDFLKTQNLCNAQNIQNLQRLIESKERATLTYSNRLLANEIENQLQNLHYLGQHKFEGILFYNNTTSLYDLRRPIFFAALSFFKKNEVTLTLIEDLLKLDQKILGVEDDLSFFQKQKEKLMSAQAYFLHTEGLIKQFIKLLLNEAKSTFTKQKESSKKQNSNAEEVTKTTNFARNCIEEWTKIRFSLMDKKEWDSGKIILAQHMGGQGLDLLFYKSGIYEFTGRFFNRILQILDLKLWMPESLGPTLKDTNNPNPRLKSLIENYNRHNLKGGIAGLVDKIGGKVPTAYSSLYSYANSMFLHLSNQPKVFAEKYQRCLNLVPKDQPTAETILTNYTAFLQRFAPIFTQQFMNKFPPHFNYTNNCVDPFFAHMARTYKESVDLYKDYLLEMYMLKLFRDTVKAKDDRHGEFDLSEAELFTKKLCKLLPQTYKALCLTLSALGERMGEVKLNGKRGKIKWKQKYTDLWKSDRFRILYLKDESGKFCKGINSYAMPFTFMQNALGSLSVTALSEAYTGCFNGLFVGYQNAIKKVLELPALKGDSNLNKETKKVLKIDCSGLKGMKIFGTDLKLIDLEKHSFQLTKGDLLVGPLAKKANEDYKPYNITTLSIIHHINLIDSKNLKLSQAPMAQKLLPSEKKHIKVEREMLEVAHSLYSVLGVTLAYNEEESFMPSEPLREGVLDSVVNPDNIKNAKRLALHCLGKLQSFVLYMVTRNHLILDYYSKR